VNRKQWFLIVALCVGVLLLSGCGIPQDGVDVRETPPDGYWQSLVVWPLANSLIWLDDTFKEMGIPYDWGFAIIAFTLVIKLLTFPLTLAQIRGMEAQKKIQPKMQELQKKYGKDRERMAQEQMKLYKEAGVNPLSGCLPLIVQMPVLFGLYSALVALGNALTDSAFFWIPDLGFPKYTAGLSWISEAFNGGDYGRLATYLVLPALLVVSQFIMQKWMTPTPTSTGPKVEGQPDMAGMTKQMGLIMTFMFGFFTLQVPAGLTLYWVTSNLLQMLQQWLITSDRFKSTPSTPVLATAGAVSDGSVAINDSNMAVIDGQAVDMTDYETNSAKKRAVKAKSGSKKKRKSKRR